MKTDYAGIDYGRMDPTVNRNPETGIRFGVIPANDVEWWWDHAEADYGDPICPECGDDRLIELPVDGSKNLPYQCAGCTYEMEEGVLPDEALSWDVDEDGLIASSGESGDIFVTKSKYFTYAQFCSPCAPGACYLKNELEEPNENNRAYCFGHDWFEDGIAPYTVYSVETGEVVPPTAKSS